MLEKKGRGVRQTVGDVVAVDRSLASSTLYPTIPRSPDTAYTLALRGTLDTTEACQAPLMNPIGEERIRVRSPKSRILCTLLVSDGTL